MNTGTLNIALPGSDSQDSDEPAPPGTSVFDFQKTCPNSPQLDARSSTSTPKASGGIKLLPSSKGVENAKKRLRAFSIQKKAPIAPVTLPKSTNAGNTTVLIGKLSSVKVTPKPEDDPKKLPKPPKPGTNKKFPQDSHNDLQKKTLSEIEDMKRKMELVELGIPLGLICPSSSNDKAMPTKAMPPIKSFLDPAKVDEIIREAKKAKAEGREFKFDYQKLLPDYDNPFQRKKEDPSTSTTEKDRRSERHDRHNRSERDRTRDKDRRKSDRYEPRRHFDHRKDDRDKYKDRERNREREKSRDKEKNKEENKKSVEKQTDKTVEKEVKETGVNLNDYLVCDSWSLDNDDKTNSSSPKVEDKAVKNVPVTKDDKTNKNAMEQLRDGLTNIKDEMKQPSTESPRNKPLKKIEKLQPVMDSFKFEIDPNDEEVLDIFDEDSDLDKYSKPKTQRQSLYGSPVDMKMFEFEADMSKDVSLDGMNEDNFLESVINEIKQEDLSDETTQDKGLVEYDMSPTKTEEEDSLSKEGRGSVTPELDGRLIELQLSQQSDYSDGYKSIESGYKSSESGYKSGDSHRTPDSFRLSIEKELDEALESKMSRSTVDSLKTWSFVLKICQPLLFRHDKNKCYKETRTFPKLWYTENPKLCSCVKDRTVVYEELEVNKMGLVDRVYGCDQIPDSVSPNKRNWYPRANLCLTENFKVTLSSEWETEDSQTEPPDSMQAAKEKRKSMTPQGSEEISLDREYQRFMDAVWPEAAEPKLETSRSTTPLRQDSDKKKNVEEERKDSEDKKKVKKIKLSEEWSQESEFEEEIEKSSRKLKEKERKRRHSSSSVSSLPDSEKDTKKKKKMVKKKIRKKSKAKSAKHHKLEKRYLKKMKEKQKKKKKQSKAGRTIEKSDDNDEEIRKKGHKKSKKKQQKLKKKNQKKRKKKIKVQSSSSSDSSTSSSSSGSSSSDSTSDTDSELERRSKKAKRKEEESRKKKKEKKKRKQSTSESVQNEELFDVNILNNIKTERLTDDEKNSKKLTDQDFSPRRQQKPRQEIINVKELQNNLVGSNIHIKQEVDDEKTLEEEEPKIDKLDLNDTNVEQITEDVGIVESKNEEIQIKDVQDVNRPILQIKTVIDESNLSQCSSQESVCSVKDQPTYEKDESHLRPSSQNSNYSFNDVIHASQIALYQKAAEETVECEEKFVETYEPENYEMYEQMAMAYQNDVANQISGAIADADMTMAATAAAAVSVATSVPVLTSAGVGFDANVDAVGSVVSVSVSDGVSVSDNTSVMSCGESRRIETVVRARRRGEIKCDWRAGDQPVRPLVAHAAHDAHAPLAHAHAPPAASVTSVHRPSRWGLKPGEVNIVLTGGNSEQFPIQSVVEPVYQIQSIANRNDNSATGYDEAYMDMYGASDRLQYGDCFAPEPPQLLQPLLSDADQRKSSLDARIDQALRDTVLGEVAKETEIAEPEREAPEKGILVSRPTVAGAPRGAKRVSFADGYKPGQDSDVEEPPAKKKKKTRRYGCAWPCPASHPDHAPLWDALPPPPPPPGSPPPSPRRAASAAPALGSPPPPPQPSAAPPLHLLHLRHHHLAKQSLLPTPPHAITHKYDSNSSLPGIMPPEPPPNMIPFP